MICISVGNDTHCIFVGLWLKPFEWDMFSFCCVSSVANLYLLMHGTRFSFSVYRSPQARCFVRHIYDYVRCDRVRDFNLME